MILKEIWLFLYFFGTTIAFVIVKRRTITLSIHRMNTEKKLNKEQNQYKKLCKEVKSNSFYYHKEEH
jgi:hypothetical protein